VGYFSKFCHSVDDGDGGVAPLSRARREGSRERNSGIQKLVVARTVLYSSVGQPVSRRLSEGHSRDQSRRGDGLYQTGGMRSINVARASSSSAGRGRAAGDDGNSSGSAASSDACGGIIAPT